jgi:hypothetical protein
VRPLLGAIDAEFSADGIAALMPDSVAAEQVRAKSRAGWVVLVLQASW